MAGKVHIQWQESAEELQALYRKEKDRQKRTRFHALWLIRTGRSVKETALVLGVSRSAIHDWLNWYKPVTGIPVTGIPERGHH